MLFPFLVRKTYTSQFSIHCRWTLVETRVRFFVGFRHMLRVRRDLSSKNWSRPTNSTLSTTPTIGATMPRATEVKILDLVPLVPVKKLRQEIVKQLKAFSAQIICDIFILIRLNRAEINFKYAFITRLGESLPLH